MIHLEHIVAFTVITLTIKGVFDWPYSIYSGIRIKFQKFSPNSQNNQISSQKVMTGGERYNSVVMFSYKLIGIVANKIE